MPKQAARLSPTQVKNAKSRNKEYNLADGKGLYLRIYPNGSKIWIFNYLTPYTKKRNAISLGKHPAMSVKQARAEREKCREWLSQGHNPKFVRLERERDSAEAESNTLKHVADKWFKIKSHDISERYSNDIYSSLVNHVFPKLGKHPIYKIRVRDVVDALEPLQETGKLEMVKRVCQRLNMIMDWAVIRGLLEINPLTPISKAFKAPKKVHLPTIKPDQLPMLMKAIGKAQVMPVTRCLMLWQLHTMVRPGEAAGARWDEIDFKKKVWVIPPERMKKKRTHSVPLSSQALEILAEVKQFSANREFIFPGDRNPKTHASGAAVNMALKRMGLKGKIVAHGFRSLASTTLNEYRLDRDLIESALAHMDKNTTRGSYNFADYLEQRQVMMQWWSDHIEEAATGMKLTKGKKRLRVIS